MILLFTDFGSEGPYLGQMESVLRLNAPGIDVINVVSNAPPGEPRLAAYLLAALAGRFPKGSVFLCVVDPGVGGERLPVVLNTLAVQAESTSWHAISWRPDNISASFHGRDLFAPVAARIARRDFTWTEGNWDGPELRGWPADIASIVYFDHFGNAITGRRYSVELNGAALLINGWRIPQATTFCDLPAGSPFWYRNSMDLIEIAVNLNRADKTLGLNLGQEFRFEEHS
jgi:S-adenosylmethionine hydrolase